MARLSAALIALVLAFSTPQQPDPQQFNPCNPKIQKCA